ncbi:MAG: AAA family ATPase [Elusimicrobia bacterium]|nr:AAA family ATPase [Elusimicrobiota bacterium]
MTVKNYRCFGSASPLSIEINEGFTAFVGPNNSGKSALLKMIVEFKSLWDTMLGGSQIGNFISRPRSMITIGYQFIDDTEEIRCDITREAPTIIFELVGEVSERHIKRIIFNVNKENLSQVMIEINTGPEHFNITSCSNGHMVSDRGERVLWSPFYEVFKKFSRSQYVPAFRNAVNTGAGTLFNWEVGTKFIETWRDWKTGIHKKRKLVIGEITRDIQKIFGFAKLEIDASIDNKHFELQINNNPYRSNEVGSGLIQFIMLFGNVAIHNPELILIDEPELNLHPALQIQLLTRLASYAKESGCVFLPHSIGLARATTNNVYGFWPTDTGTKVSLFHKMKTYAEFAGALSYGEYSELGNEWLLLVEGVNDVKTIHMLLGLIGLQRKAVVIPLLEEIRF